MRLLHLHIQGFGQLRGRIDLDAGEGSVGLFLEKNEVGKTTLSAAILAGLYGLDGDRRRFRGTVSDLDRYRPWNGGSFGLSLNLEHEGQEYVIDRDFERDTVRVLHGAADITDQFRRGGQVAVGELLTGLRKEQFTASTFVGQGDVVWSDAQKLTEALQRVADSQSGRSTAASAIEALDRALERYDGVTLAQPGRVDTEIKRCSERIEVAQRELSSLESEKGQLGELMVELAGSDADREALEFQRRAIRARRLGTERTSIESVLEEAAATDAEILAIETQIERDPALAALSESRRQAVEKIRRAIEHAGMLAKREQAELDLAEQEVEAHTRRLQDSGVARIPYEDELDALAAARHRIADAHDDQQRWEAALGQEHDALASIGFDVDTAMELARDFDAWSEEDRSIVVGRTARQTQCDEQRAGLEADLAHNRRSLEDIVRGQDRRRRNGFIPLGVGALAAAAGFAFAESIPVPMLLTVVSGGVVTLAGLILVLIAPGHGRREEDRLRAATAEIARGLQQVEQDEIADELQWTAMAQRLDVEPESIQRRYEDWCRVEQRARALMVYRDRAREAQLDRTQALDSIQSLAALFDEEADETRIDSWLETARKAAQIARKLEEARTRARVRGEIVAKHRAQIVEHETTLRAALGEAGLELVDTTSLEDLLGEFDARVDAVREIDELRRIRIPALQRRALDAQRRQAHAERLSTIVEERDRLLAEVHQQAARFGPRVQALVDALDTPIGQTETDQALASVDQAERMRQDSEGQRRTSLRSFLERYESEAPVLRTDIEVLQTAHDRAFEFKAAVELARDSLTEISQQTHRIWAVALQKTTSEFLAAMGSEVSEVRFDEHLGLQLRQHGKLLTGAEAPRVLSTGALDAVFLAARLAVARFLTRGSTSLPLILDDPLANADDSRLLSTLKLLVDAVAPQQQVLLLACQHSRYDWARSALERPGALVTLRLNSNGADRASD